MILLSAADVRDLLPPGTCREAVEAAFRDLAMGRTRRPGVLGFEVDGGGFHMKAGVLGEAAPRFVAKTNANFPSNPAKGLPTIQGLLLLFDAVDGTPLAVMDSASVTVLRTAAATAVAASRLARPESAVLLVCGCGEQGRAHLPALLDVLPLREVIAIDQDPAKATGMASFAADLGLEARVSTDLRASLRDADVCVTCTPSRRWLIDAADVRPGTFVAGVGADNPQKQELSPALLRASSVWADVLEQSETMGDLHHAIAQGFMKRSDVRGELGELVVGVKPGRRDADEITVFDSTGMALQDVAAASIVYDRAVAERRGMRFQFAALTEGAGFGKVSA